MDRLPIVLPGGFVAWISLRPFAGEEFPSACASLDSRHAHWGQPDSSPDHAEGFLEAHGCR